MHCRLLLCLATTAALSPPSSTRKTPSLRRATTSLSGRGRGLLQAYDSVLKRRPLPTKCASSGVASAIGDALAQSFAGGAYDPRRTLVFAVIGICYFGPLLHGWYKMLNRFETGVVGSGRLTRPQAIALMLLLNQSIGAMAANGGFFYAYAGFDRWLPGGANAPVLATASAALGEKFWRVMKANWVVWPLPSLCNLALVPLEYRVLFMNSFAVVWKCVLSLLTRSAA